MPANQVETLEKARYSHTLANTNTKHRHAWIKLKDLSLISRTRSIPYIWGTRHQQLEEQEKQPHHVIAGARRWSVFASPGTSFVRQGHQWRPCPPSFGACEIQIFFQTATVDIQNKGFMLKIFMKHSSYTSSETVHIHMTTSPNNRENSQFVGSMWIWYNLMILRPCLSELLDKPGRTFDVDSRQCVLRFTFFAKNLSWRFFFPYTMRRYPTEVWAHGRRPNPPLAPEGEGGTAPSPASHSSSPASHSAWRCGTASMSCQRSRWMM